MRLENVVASCASGIIVTGSCGAIAQIESAYPGASVRTRALSAKLETSLGAHEPSRIVRDQETFDDRMREMRKQRLDANRSEWYGWQTLMVDAAALAIVLGSEGDAMGAVVPEYLFVPPVIHLTHGELPSAGASLALRFFLPLAGLTVALATATEGGLVPSPSPVPIIAGWGAAVAVDATFLARESGPDR